MSDTSLHPTTLIARNKWSDDRKTIWGDSFNWSWVRPWSQLQGILIHHSVTKHDATADDIALLHKARGWAGIGYHFVITKDGVVHYVGDISTARAHVANKNEKFLGICLVGDFTKHLPSDDQILSAHDLVKFFLTETPSLPTLNNWNQLGGHKDQQATACPGTSWTGATDSMRERIVNRIPYSPVPTPEPTPEPPVVEPSQCEKELAYQKTEVDRLLKLVASTKNEYEGKMADQKRDCQSRMDTFKANLIKYIEEYL